MYPKVGAKGEATDKYNDITYCQDKEAINNCKARIFFHELWIALFPDLNFHRSKKKKVLVSLSEIYIL